MINPYRIQAHYYATRRERILVILGNEFIVSGKREARRLALSVGATPWNF
jgi:hypothetical protein